MTYLALLLVLGIALDCKAITITNSKLSATITTDGLLSAGHLKIVNDSWGISTSNCGTTKAGTDTILTPAACPAPTLSSADPSSPSSNYATAVLEYKGCSGGYDVRAHYFLKTSVSNYVSKVLTIHSAACYTVGEVQVYGANLRIGKAGPSTSTTGTTSTTSPDVMIRENPFNPRAGQIAAFIRFGDDAGSGAFVSVTNPYTQLGSSGGGSDDGACAVGINYKNGDLPGSPLHGVGSAADCKTACSANAKCLGFVWNAAGCEGTPPPGNCYLKGKLEDKTAEGCSCSAIKPFPPPAPAPPGPPPSATTGITATYTATMVQQPAGSGAAAAYHTTDEGVIGLTATGKYTVGGVGANLVYMGERRAFVTCVEEHYLDTASRANSTVKVNVAWDESDYQIDVGTAAGQTEYHRIIDRNSQFGAGHIVYEPANSLRGSRFNTTDGWGWEGSLWFSMGELVREGKWDPLTDEVPAEILAMSAYAASKGVKLLSYVYPCLPFQPLKAHWVGQGTNVVNLGAVEVQDWYIARMLAFMKKTGAGGWAWDHDIFAGDASLHYSQWRGWMRILAALRAEYPDMVMDHRQTAHAWGPWYQLAGSYDEPIAGDENPETYGVPIASLHTDHVAADNTRIVNFKYSTGQLIPASRIPGFAFHQTERTADNGTNPCFSSSKLCYDSNVRDFDLLGYKYSLLSTIGTAGQNNVLTMIPARDEEEFNKFPAADMAFIKDWLAWTDTNLRFLRNTISIAQLGSPSVGSVDGTSSMDGDEGYIFLFNPGFYPLTANFTVDEAVGLSNASAAATWTVTELYPAPTEYTVDTWAHGAAVAVRVDGSDARVLKLTKVSAPTAATTAGKAATLQVVGAAATHAAAADSSTVALRGVSGPTGTQVDLRVLGSSDAHTEVTIDGRKCATAKTNAAGELAVTATFGGDVVQHAMPISPDAVPPQPWAGGWLNTTFTVSAAMKAQSAARQAAYPIDWTPAEYKATWLVPARLLIYAFIIRPAQTMKVELMVDGKAVEVSQSYNSRALTHARTFLGFYFDASNMAVGSPHSLSINVEKGVDFQGLFWENLETEHTNQVIAC